MGELFGKSSPKKKEMDKYDIDGYRKMASPKNLEKMSNPSMLKMENNFNRIQH